MIVDMETRLGMRIGTFVPAEAALSFRYPDTPGGIEPTVQTYIGGVTDRESRAPSTRHPRRGVVLVEAPYADFTVLPDDLWSACDAPPAHEWVLEQIRPGGRPSPADAGGLCISAMEVDPAIEGEFNEWYNEEHMPLMDAVPGMLAARRFHAVSGLPRYVAVYHLESPEVYKQPSWYEANQTPWIRRIHRHRLRTLHMILERVQLPG
ncbi:MAG: hypothetical protein WD767_09370 [Alphaproteobacteria bacterium]